MISLTENYFTLTSKMNRTIHEILTEAFLEDLRTSVKTYLKENYSYVNQTDFDINPEFLGIDIIHSIENDVYTINFNNIKHMSFQRNQRNPYFGVTGSGSIRLRNVSLDGFEIKRGIVLGDDNYQFFIKHTGKFMDSYIYAINNPVVDKEYKLEILNNFESLLEENPKELVIDKYIENHPFILELSLHLTQLNHQVILENIEEDFDQDLKPDVIAFRPLDKCWCIVDYKRANRKVLKKTGEVRSGFRAEVNDLTYQLDDYINYFLGSRVQTEYVKETFGLDVKYPKGIGIIGNICVEDEEDYLKAARRLPKGIDIFPYNYIIEECRRVLTLQ